MKLTSAQRLICDTIIDVPMGIAEIQAETNLSASYIRTQVKILEMNGRIEKVDNRQPFIYRVPKESVLYSLRDRIQKYFRLLSDPKAETDNSFVTLLRQVDKDEWPAIADELKAIVEVIEHLESQGKLTPSLEGMLPK